MRYFKRVDEGPHPEWGDPTYFLEVNDAGDAVRQVEAYPNGRRLRYGPGDAWDRDGGLSVMVVDGDDDDWRAYAITRDEFEQAWQAGHGDCDG